MDIRYAASALAAISPGLRAQMNGALELERAELALAVVTPPYAHKMVDAERRRRHTELHMSLMASYESVREDLITGRWDPR